MAVAPGTIQLEDMHPHWHFQKPTTTRNTGQINSLEMPPSIDPLLSIYEPAEACTKGRPTGPRELPTCTELARERSTRRNPSEFEHVEDYLAQRSSQSTAISRRRKIGGRGVRGGSTAYIQAENRVGGNGTEPLKALTASQVARQEEDLYINEFFGQQQGQRGGRGRGRPCGRGRGRGRERGHGGAGGSTSGQEGEERVFQVFDPINGIFNMI